MLAKKRYVPPKKRVAALSDEESDREGDDPPFVPDLLKPLAGLPLATGGNGVKPSKGGGGEEGSGEHSEQCCGYLGRRTRKLAY